MKKQFFYTFFYTLLFTFFSLNTLFGQHEIKVKLTDYKNDTLCLGYPMGDKQFVRDTVIGKDKDGFFVFKGSEALPVGMYFVIMRPDNAFFQIMVGEKDQNFSITTKVEEAYVGAVVKNSKENKAFFDYMLYVNTQRQVAVQAQEMMKKDDKKTPEAKIILDRLDKEVKAYQGDLVKNNPNTVVGSLIKAAVEVDLPEFQDPDKDLKTYYYFKQHYFDNYDMSNAGLFRTPIMFPRIDYYVNKLTPQTPDSINESIDYVLDKVKGNKEALQYYIVYFLNTYAKSKIVGFDGVYVHIAKKYISTGLIDDYIDANSKAKIVQNAAKIEPLLLGKTAPDLRVFRQDSSVINLRDIKADYTVVYFWSPTCGHCQKSMPALSEFYKNFKSKNVEVFSVCSRPPDEVVKCWDFIKEKEIGEWVNAVDPYEISRYRTLFNVETTPTLYILDKNKKILTKNIGTEQLAEVLTRIMEEDKAALQTADK